MKFLTAALICGVALLLPYKARVFYGRMLAWVVHAPYILFGRLARYILRKLGIEGFPRVGQHGR